MKKFIAFNILFFSALCNYAQVGHWEQSAMRNYEAGLRLFDKQLFAAASDKFSHVLDASIDPTHEIYVGSEYYHAMCAVYLMNKDAEELVSGFVRNHPTSPRTQDAIWYTSEFMFNTRKYKQSAEWLQKIDKNTLSEEDRSAYHFRLGYSFFSRKEYKMASDQFYQIKNGNGKYASSGRYYYAHIAYIDSNYNTALENFKPLLEDPSFGAIVPYYLAQIYYKTGDMDALLEVGSKLISKSEKRRVAEIAKLLGQAYLEKKNYEQAVIYLGMHRDNGGKMTQGDHYSLGYCYYNLGEYEQAITSFNKIKGGKNETAQHAYYHLGDCYVRTDRKNEAMAAFKAAMDIKKGDERIRESAFFNYAKLNYEMANPYEDAIQALKRFLTEYPNSMNKSDANRYLANLYITTKDYDNALASIAEAGLNTPEMRSAYQKVAYFLGVEFYNALQTDKAIELFSESLKYPFSSTYVALAHYWMGESWFKKKDYPRALESYASYQSTPGADRLSEYVMSQYNKGYCYFMQEDYASAAASFKLFYNSGKLVGKQRLRDDASLRLGDSYFMLSRYSSAVTFYNDVAGSKRKDADYALFQRSLCQGLMGKDAEKILSLSHLLNQYPQSKYKVEARYEMGSTYFKMDQNQKALAEFDLFLKEHSNSRFASKAMLNKGVIQRNLKDYNASISTFQEIVKKYPSTAEANEAISFAKLVYAQANRIEEYVDWVSSISFADVKRASLDSTVYSAAFDQYSQDDCEKAIRSFESYLNRFADGLFVQKAQYYMADCYYRKHDDAKAEEIYKEVVSHPKGQYTEISLARLAGINYAAEDYAEALLYYEELASSAEEVNRLRDAYVGILRSAEQLKDDSKVVQYAEIIMNDDKFDPEVRNEAMLFRARSLWNLKEMAKAYQAYTVLREKAQGEPKAEATYYVAKLQNMEGKHEASNETIFWMIENLPSYKYWRFRSLLVLAENYWKLDDAFQANYTLDFILNEQFDDEITEEAKTLRETIRRDEEQKKLEQEKEEEEMNQIVPESEADEPSDNDEDSEVPSNSNNTENEDENK